MPAPRLREALLLYLGMPLLMDQVVAQGGRHALLPVLWAVALWALWIVSRSEPHWVRSLLYSGQRLELPRWWLVRTGGGLVLLAVVACLFLPLEFLRLPREQPVLWLLVVLAYPLLSVLPQGVIYRALWAKRYAPSLRPLGESWLVLALGTAAFAFGHLIFRNSIAVLVTASGGALFLHTYLATRSFWLATLEHALYGVAAFTFGFGRFLYLGATRGSG